MIFSKNTHFGGHGHGSTDFRLGPKCVKVTTFEAKNDRKKTTAEQVKTVLAVESTIGRNLYFVDGLDEKDKKAVFQHEWTSYPGSLFQPNAAFEQGFVMRKRNKADFINGMKTCLGDDWPAHESPPSMSTDGGCSVVGS